MGEHKDLEELKCHFCWMRWGNPVVGNITDLRGRVTYPTCMKHLRSWVTNYPDRRGITVQDLEGNDIFALVQLMEP
jgi:hypothetical protein